MGVRYIITDIRDLQVPEPVAAKLSLPVLALTVMATTVSPASLAEYVHAPLSFTTRILVRLVSVPTELYTSAS
jgi:hypothetical protein